MSTLSPYFTSFNQSVNEIALPERFTFPFYYEPHPLCLIAAKELQAYLSTQTDWQHNFGIDFGASHEESLHIDNKKLEKTQHNSVVQVPSGKMFGVLLVKNQQGEIGYLSAFSGKLADKSLLPGFVPPVCDLLNKDSFFIDEQKKINDLNSQLAILESNQQIAVLTEQVSILNKTAEEQIEAQRQLVIAGRKHRKEQREQAKIILNDHQQTLLNARLSKESVADKNALIAIKQQCYENIAQKQLCLDSLLDEISILKTKRKTLSHALQQKIFAQYQFLNGKGEIKDLNSIFDASPDKTPPAGSGECAAPKLLHYAYKEGLMPLAMAEFWWGASPKSEVRQHGNFYPACQSKCQPILGHMLQGLMVDENPLLVNPAKDKELSIVYQDDDMLVINKPAEFLSVPGKNIEDSVYFRIKQQFPHATGPLIVHRLDMSTSGLMVIALHKRAHKNLQKQFIQRTVKKRYIALLNGDLTEDNGTINLPIRVDLNDRPRQLVCYEYGKPAETYWQVIERFSRSAIDKQYHSASTDEQAKYTKVHLYPKTGRTHQLRVHCAHTLGLSTPIVGDDHYGIKANRLHLHAEYLALEHPLSKEPLSFHVEANF